MKSIRARETAQASPPGIVARRSAVATKTDPPLLETPQAVSVITREQLDAHAVQSLDQAVLYTAGISGSLYDKVDAQGRLLYRLTGLARDAGTQTDYTKDRRLTIAPAFTWQPSHNTSFTVLMQYQHDTPDSSGPVRTVIGTAKWQR
jgi:outer membrane receptor protein involved in Fe transport